MHAGRFAPDTLNAIQLDSSKRARLPIARSYSNCWIREVKNDYEPQQLQRAVSYALRRYARGLMPNSARNARLKFDTSPNPHSNAISNTCVRSFFSRSAARRRRVRSRY